ncbi:hypothetical protein GCM10012276_08500 [Nocardioides deserti]|nr:hypothetical protein GCM10012276_08500 [Nocardioides deserti]
MSGSTWEMWFITRMQPPRSGIRSPPSHSWRVVARSVGFTIATATFHAHPRFCCSFRTVTTGRLLARGDGA